MAQSNRPPQIVRGAVNPPRRLSPVKFSEPARVRLTEQPAGVPETKRQRFIRLAEARMDKVLMALDNLRKLADSEYYEFSEADLLELNIALRAELDRLNESFQAGREVRGFKLNRR